MPKSKSSRRRNDASLVDASTADLVTRYADAAKAHGEGTESGSSRRANAAYERIATIYRELRRRGPEAQSQLLSLLDHADPGVRGWAGAHALDFAPHLGEPVLIALGGVQGSLVSLSAEVTLREWRAGRLEFP